MVFPAGVVVVIIVLPGFPTAAAGMAGMVSGVVVVVVVVTERVGAGGGGEETVSESGPEAQPARRPRTPQNVRTGVSRLITHTEVERDRKVVIFVFIAADYTPGRSTTMGCSTKRQ
jgi:hypothetical protein